MPRCACINYFTSITTITRKEKEESPVGEELSNPLRAIK